MSEQRESASAGSVAFLQVNGLVKTFANAKVIDNLSFSISRGECLTLLGPSGCGKTTTLRCIAGFESPDAGMISIDGVCVQDSAREINVPPERRQFGMVFQSYAVWPHMTVAENVAYGLSSRGVSRAEATERVSAILRSVGLEGREMENVTKLSGGQQQRVALARALVYRPKVLLFDEPLSNLDAKLRQRMRREIKNLHDKLGITSVYVTHDQEEAMVVSDRIIVMNEGRMQQVGSPSEIYDQPANRFVADFVGNSNILKGRFKNSRSNGLGIVELENGDGLLYCTMRVPCEPESEVFVTFHPEQVQIHSRVLDGAVNVLPGVIGSRSNMGSFIDYRVLMGDQELRVNTARDVDFSEGERVFLRVDARACLCLSS